MRNREPVLFAALIVLFLAPVWWFAYFPTQDGPTHVYNAKILSDYFWVDGSPFRNFLYINPRFDPTWLVHSVLSSLMLVFPPLVAEKILISSYVIALPLALRYAVTGVNASAGFLSLLLYLLHIVTLGVGYLCVAVIGLVSLAAF